MTSESKRPDSDRVKNTDPVVTSRSSDCYVAANRLLLGQYRVQVSGKDAELMAKDRYEVAVALIEQRRRIRSIAGLQSRDRSRRLGYFHMSRL